MNAFKEDMPIYLQLRQQIEEQILARALKEEDQVKSLRVLATEYRINPITAGNAITAWSVKAYFIRSVALGFS